MDYEIIPMSAEHIKAVSDIEKACFASPWSEEGLREELANPNSHFIVAAGSEVMGYMGVQEVCGEAYITNVAVMPGYRRMGVGRALVTAAIEGARVRGCEFITLEVRESNAPAISLYSFSGFTEAGRRKHFYTKPDEDALLMTLYFEKGQNL